MYSESQRWYPGDIELNKDLIMTVQEIQTPMICSQTFFIADHFGRQSALSENTDQTILSFPSESVMSVPWVPP